MPRYTHVPVISHDITWALKCIALGISTDSMTDEEYDEYMTGCDKLAAIEDDVKAARKERRA